MTRSELIAGLAEDNPHLTIADVERIVAALFDEMTDALARGERVELRGFGAFTVKQRNARAGRNPAYRVRPWSVAQKSVPFLKPARSCGNALTSPCPMPGPKKNGGVKT